MGGVLPGGGGEEGLAREVDVRHAGLRPLQADGAGGETGSMSDGTAAAPSARFTRGPPAKEVQNQTFHLQYRSPIGRSERQDGGYPGVHLEDTRYPDAEDTRIYKYEKK